jgi:hypothetical protein
MGVRMMHKSNFAKPVIVVIAALSIAVLSTSAAFASYGDTSGSLGAPSTVSTGESVSVSATGFKADSEVSVVLRSDPVTLGTFTASSSGALNASVTIPTSTPAGSHTLTASGVDPSGNPYSVTQAIEVEAAGSSLPRTGSDVLVPLLIAAVALCGIGFVAVRTTRRRRQSSLL